MRLLVDTSVWSLALRKKGPDGHPAVERLAQSLRDGEDLVLTGAILQEILQAFRAESTFLKMARRFDAFALLPLERADHVAAARLHRTCARNGIAASTVDCQIAMAAMRHRCALLTADRDFERIAQHCDLVLA